MDNELLDIDRFNVVSDEENYYFFRALNMADNSDIENGITVSSDDGKIEKIRRPNIIFFDFMKKAPIKFYLTKKLLTY